MSNTEKHDGLAVLGREPLSLRELIRLTRGNHRIVADEEAVHRVHNAHRTMVRLAEHGMPVYGVTRGVGQNADRELFGQNGVRPWREVRGESIQANYRLLHSHSAGIGDPLPPDVVRAAILIRLNGLLHGQTGCRTEVVEHLLRLLNENASMRLPSIGSVGQADIALCGRLGLEDSRRNGDVVGQFVPEGRDALSLVSTNAVSVARACLVIDDLEKSFSAAEVVFLASLNGLNGNVAPLYSAAVAHQSPRLSARRRAFYEKALSGSFLTTHDANRKLQDPLSFRCSPVVFELASRSLKRCEEALDEFFRCVEDNPMVLSDDDAVSRTNGKGGTDHRSPHGRVLPNANFCPMLLAMELGTLSNMISQLGILATQRMLRLSETQHTRLNRFLAATPDMFGFCALQKVPVALAAELRADSNASVLDLASTAGGVEDFPTHLPLIIRSLESNNAVIANLVSIELLHACQAMSLRRLSNPSVKFGVMIDEVLGQVREHVPVYRDDRELTHDIEVIKEIVSRLPLLRARYADLGLREVQNVAEPVAHVTPCGSR